MGTLSEELAAAIAAHDPGSLGPAVTAKATLALLDFLGCAFESLDLPPSRQAIAAAPTGSGGPIIGARRTTTPADAAFANAVMGHGLVREDMHAASVCHHGVVVWPLLFACAGAREVTGLRLLQAAVLAYEVGGRLGRALITPEVSARFRPTGLVAPIGAAAGAAWLHRLDAAQIASAIALAANTASGLNQWPASGGSDMYFHPGFAARNAWQAVRLAEAGAYGSPDILEGPAGYFAAFARTTAPEAITLFPKGQADILAVYHKAAPACNFAQAACQTALRLHEMLGSSSAPVAAIRVAVPRAAATYPGCDSRGPFDRALQAKMSIAFSVAAVFVHGRIAESNYRDLGDPDVLRLVAATTVEASDELTRAFPDRQGAAIEIALEDGRRLSTALPDTIPATEAEIRSRFRDAATAVFDAATADQIEAAVDRLDEAPSARRLVQLCSAGIRRSGKAGAPAKAKDLADNHSGRPTVNPQSI
jgi:2-methylcitrate dehydratase PrpD